MLDVIDNLVKEINSSDQSEEDEFHTFNFTTAKNGMQISYTRKSIEYITHICNTLILSDKFLSKSVENIELVKIMRQCVAEMQSTGKFKKTNNRTIEDIKSDLLKIVRESIKTRSIGFTHYFPARTLGMEVDKPIKLGPVTIMTIDQWIESVDISESLKNNYLGEAEANHQWKTILRNSRKDLNCLISGYANDIHEFIGNHNSILKITINNREVNFSAKIAEMICKSALDSISLIISSLNNDKNIFYQQYISSEKLPPIRKSNIIEINGHLSIPGIELGKQMPNTSPKIAAEILRKAAVEFDAVSNSMHALIDENLHTHPKLANRWFMALDWFAEGCRENSDAIAVAKIATSLDILSCVGTNNGILELAENLLGRTREDIINFHTDPKSLKKFVKNLYDDGRSKILHGSYANRLESYSIIRNQAQLLGRVLLIEGIKRLKNYNGPDADKAFRTMPRAPHDI